MQSLAAAYRDLTGDVGHYLGYSRGAGNGESTWLSTQQGNIDRCVKGGMRKFYFCGYDWSFLKPIASLSLASSGQTILLPEDFGGIEGDLLLTDDTRVVYRIPVTGDTRHRHGLSPSATGEPQVVEVEPIKGTGFGQQRFQLRVWPIADQAYTLQCRYYVNPDYLSGAFRYAYGGPQHAETLLEACLSVAEILLDDMSGVHAQEFEKLLEISKDLDRRNKPQTLGYCGDRSDAIHSGGWWRRDMPTITFDGVTPS